MARPVRMERPALPAYRGQRVLPAGPVLRAPWGRPVLRVQRVWLARLVRLDRPVRWARPVWTARRVPRARWVWPVPRGRLVLRVPLVRWVRRDPQALLAPPDLLVRRGRRARGVRPDLGVYRVWLGRRALSARKVPWDQRVPRVRRALPVRISLSAAASSDARSGWAGLQRVIPE